MKVLQLVETINGKLITNEATKDNSFEGVYVGDLLSNVMANIKEDNLFVTIMCNINTIAVASPRDIPIIVFCEGKQATQEMINKANELEIALIETPINAAEVIRKIYTI